MTSARVFLLHRLLLAAAAFAVALAGTQLAAPGRPATRPVASTAAPAQFRPLPVPARILDTRPQYNVPNLGYSTPFGQQMRQVQVAGIGGLPASGITAVVMNVTVTNGTAASFLTIYPSSSAAPNTSFLNWGPDQVKPNLIQVEVGQSDGRIDAINQRGTVDVIMDVAGYFTTPAVPDTAGLYNPVAPLRILDTRPLYGPIPAGGRATPIGQDPMDVVVAGFGNVPATGAEAVVLNITVTNTTSESFLTAWPAGQPRPNASNLNWFATHTEPNRVIVPLSPGGKITLFNSLGTADVIVDVDGWFSDGTIQTTGQQMMSVPPVRVLDTRPQYTPAGPYNRPLAKDEWRAVPIAGANGLPAMTATVAPSAVVLNVTVTGTSEASFLSAYPPAATRPTVSDLNWAPGETVPNMVVVKLADDGSIRVYNSEGCTDVIFDLVGWYTGPAVAASTPPQPSAQANCVLPPPPPPPRPAKPVHVDIWTASHPIHANVEEVGADANGNLGSPANIWDAAWFNGMPRPGENGNAIMSGHVDWYNSPTAAFSNLKSVQLGEEIFVDRADGSTVRFIVDNKVYVPYQNPPPWVFSSDPPAQLTLITCAGYWDGTRYTERLAVHGHIG